MMQIHKHIDFQVPGWGEFLQGPTLGLGALLSQSSSASFPDRPGKGGVGLDVTMTVGDEGSYLTHDMGVEQSVLHLRFFLSPMNAGGGSVTLLTGLDGAGLESLRVSLDTGGGNLAVWFSGGTTLASVLDAGVVWHCIEIAVDTAAGLAELWVNGVSVDQDSADLSASTIQTILLGAVHKDANVTGSLYIDEAVVADSYIGPVVVAPVEPHAGDPARWLVVYNSEDPHAGAWAEAYRQARNIPYANLAGLALPLAEAISVTQYTDLVTAVDSYLSLNQLGGQIMGVLLGYRVPGYIDSIGEGMYQPVPAQLQTSSAVLGPAPNPLASPASYKRISMADLAGNRMTARIDGPDLISAIDLIDRATEIHENNLNSEDSLFYFDPFVGDGAIYQSAFNEMLDWVKGEGGAKTRLNIILSGDPNGNEDAGFDSVSGDSVFWGWSLTLPDPDIFSSPAGRRAFCAQIYLDGASATTLRSVVPGNWAETPLAAGYASVVASSRNSPVFWMPNAGAIFDALTLGWTLAEAWFIAQPVIRGGFYLVGDPLMRIGMPRAGYEVFGPLDSLRDLDSDSPAFILPAGTHQIDISNAIPEEGTQAIYVFRRSDGLGRSESSSTSIRVANIGGQSLGIPMLPAWPDTEGWLADVEDEQIRMLACWAGPIEGMRVALIELLGQPEGGSEAVVSMPALHPIDDHVLVLAPRPETRTRYRWRVTSIDGVGMHTAWSTYIDPSSIPTVSVQQIGANS